MGKLRNVSGESEEKLYETTLRTIGVVAKLPVVRVNRESFLRQQFHDSPHLDAILENGPQSVYTPESLRRKANGVIRNSTAVASVASFAAGLPGNPVTMVAMGGADMAQYFGFALNLAQKIAYLFGEDDLFEGGQQLSEDAQARVIGYLGVMLGAAGAAGLVAHLAGAAAPVMGKKVANKALMKTVWYPVVKKVATAIGQKMTKNTMGKVVTKSVPVVGGVMSGGITYATFRPMGGRLADTLYKNLKGEFHDEMELNPEFAASPEAVIIRTDPAAEAETDK